MLKLNASQFAWTSVNNPIQSNFKSVCLFLSACSSVFDCVCAYILFYIVVAIRLVQKSYWKSFMYFHSNVYFFILGRMILSQRTCSLSQHSIVYFISFRFVLSEYRFFFVIVRRVLTSFPSVLRAVCVRWFLY